MLKRFTVTLLVLLVLGGVVVEAASKETRYEADWDSLRQHQVPQ